MLLISLIPGQSATPNKVELLFYSLVVLEVVRHQKGHSEKTRLSIKSRMDAVCVDSGLQLGPSQIRPQLARPLEGLTRDLKRTNPSLTVK